MDNCNIKSHEEREEDRKKEKEEVELNLKDEGKNGLESEMFFGKFNRWITTKEASVYLGVSVGQIRNMVWRGQLVTYRISNRLRFLKSDLDKIVKPSHNWRKL